MLPECFVEATGGIETGVPTSNTVDLARPLPSLRGSVTFGWLSRRFGEEELISESHAFRVGSTVGIVAVGAIGDPELAAAIPTILERFARQVVAAPLSQINP